MNLDFIEKKMPMKSKVANYNRKEKAAPRKKAVYDSGSDSDSNSDLDDDDVATSSCGTTSTAEPIRTKRMTVTIFLPEKTNKVSDTTQTRSLTLSVTTLCKLPIT